MNLKKFISLLGVAVLAIGVFGSTIAFTSAQTTDDTPAETESDDREGHRGEGRRGNREKPEWFDEDLYKSTMAAELGMTVEELEAMKENREKPEDITREDIKNAMEVAFQAVLDQAVANGDLTEEEAAEMAERKSKFGKRGGKKGGGKHGGKHGHRQAPEWLDKELMQQTVADELGLTVEDLEAARENRELPEGVTREDVKAAMEVGFQAVLDQAVANGDLTAEEAAEIQEKMEDGGRRGFGKRDGKGNRGGGDATPAGDTNA